MKTKKMCRQAQNGPERDIGAELLESIRQIKAGQIGRITTFETQPDGSVVCRVTRGDGTLEKETQITGSRADLMIARQNSGLSQDEFSRMLGISKRTLEKWEQGKTKPSGAAATLLHVAALRPDAVRAVMT